MDHTELKKLLGATMYARALRYYERGRVHDYTEAESQPGTLNLTASVTGTERYDVRVWLRQGGEFVSADCTCPYNMRGDGPLCKHIGAVLLQYIDHNTLDKTPSLQTLLSSSDVHRGADFHSSLPAPEPLAPGSIRSSIVKPASTGYASNLDALFGRKWRGPEIESDLAAQQLLRLYRAEAERAADAAALIAADQPLPGTVTLEPELQLDSLHPDAPAELRLRVGAGGRRYLVKDLTEFSQAFGDEREIRYGAKLCFAQRREAYAAEALPLLDLVDQQVALIQYSAALTPYNRARTPRPGALPLAPHLLDALVGLYADEGFVGGYELRTGMPRFTLSTQQRKGGVALCLTPVIDWVSGQGSIYYYSDDTLWKADKASHRRMQPLLKLLAGRELFFSSADATAFCSYVMPEVRAFVTLEDPERLLLDKIPLRPVVQFFLDTPTPLRVTAYVQFLYGEDTVSPFSPPPADLLRDTRTEQEAAALLGKAMHASLDPHEKGLFEAVGEDEVIRLLDEGIPALLAVGEVYMSDNFRTMEAPRPKVSVGIAVAGTVLDLTVDTGEFPADELRGLLASLHAKKKYHRLTDGRLLRIDSSMDVLEDLDETLELSGAKLDGGHAQLPLYRAPSLDKALSGQENLRFRRDDAFRAISRSFHGVADSDYTLPESLQGVLRKYQRTGYRWLRTLDDYGMGGILADDMGLGKTLQVLAYLLALKESGETAPSLIVCPASLVLNWAEECAKFTPQLRCMAVDGTAAQRAQLAETFGEYDLIVTGYDLLRRDGELYEKHIFRACILDEAQAIKNHTTQKYKAVCRVRSRVRFALTGTPIENRLSELWSIFSFLMPGYLYPYAIFREKLERPIAQERSEAAVRRLNQLTGPFVLRRMKREVLKELPPKIENVYHIQFEEQQRKLYLAAVLDAKQKLQAIRDEDKIQVFAVLTRLRQICCDPRLMADNWDGGSAKLDACADLIASAVDGGHQILLFSQFTSMLSLLEKRLDELDISHYTLQGSTPKPVRAELVRSFNEGGANVFLISLKAGGTGLNLTAADIVIHYDPWWNVAAQNQATDRAYRIGQQNTVQVYKLIAQDTIEEKILEMQQAKQELADTITGSAEGSILHMSKEEILGLLD